ncbi:DUF1772 domain-containing protein [Chamaesiphon minutus]|uniref:Putative integral membrane protein n=1 Tax=Chamaesiphon minutus (strain ATCC 27169 / PCC 6605) TaxID=1173020 RepID=K9UEZ1_CHAP6|nr:anthrone oxygenase family protein [Chamaesiphon minutus]AFY92996.1 putative integral membrane protein [Chamaesiphon minutus PCC 6605]
MLDRYLFWVTFAAAIGCGLNAGVFFAFSTFVMPALARLKPDRGIAAMQSMNITAINPLFMLALLGTAVACLFIFISTLIHWHQSGTIYLAIGSLLYLVGAILVTMLGNVPLNNALANVDPNSTEGTVLWAKYLTDWTFWNHVRTLAALAASATFIFSLTK